eukprot:6206715-Pleurochrysis_carterae.AAC.1
MRSARRERASTGACMLKYVRVSRRVRVCALTCVRASACACAPASTVQGRTGQQQRRAAARCPQETAHT